MKWWIIGGSLILVGALVAIVWPMLGSGIPVEAARAQRTQIRQFVDERGKTRLPEVHLITMPFDGRVERIAIVERDEVRKGDVVARIVSSDLEDAVAEAKAVVERLEESIRKNDDVTVEGTSKTQTEKFVESMIHTLATAQSRMDSGKARMDYAEAHLGRVARLFQSGTKTQDEMDRAQLAHVEAQLDYRQAELIWRATASIKAASDLLPQMVQQFIDRKGLTRSVLEKQKAEATARLSQIETRRRRGQMRSPVDGVVLERLVSNERHLPAGQILLRIGQLERLEVETDVLSQDVADVQEGQTVEIYGPAIARYNGGKAVGYVRRIYPAGFTKVSSLGVEQQRVKVIIGLAEGELAGLQAATDLGVDYRVRVRIFTAAAENTLVVPRSALFRGADGGWQVFEVLRGRARLTPVEVGLMNDRQVEILKGLSDNDVVVLAPETSLVDGARVKPLLRPR